MKIGVVSTYNWLLRWDNYGSLLQIYALQVFLERHGHDAYLIRALGESKSKSDQHKKPSFLSRLLSAVRRPRAIVRRFEESPDENDDGQRIADFDREHPRGFKDFLLRRIAMTEREYTSEDLIREPPPADAYIAGSEQVWAVVSTANFLRFGDKSAKRLAYAVSRPWAKDSEEWRNEAEEAVKELDAISVRELEGIEVCRRIGRDDAVHVVDPVLLLERSDYTQLVEKEDAAQSFQSPFILAYLVNVDDLAKVPWKEMQEFGMHEKKDLKVVPLQGSELLMKLSRPQLKVVAPGVP